MQQDIHKYATGHTQIRNRACACIKQDMRMNATGHMIRFKSTCAINTQHTYVNPIFLIRIVKQLLLRERTKTFLVIFGRDNIVGIDEGNGIGRGF